MEEAQYGTLANGLRVVTVPKAGPVTWCGLAVMAGSRDDPQGHFGLAHFVEHTLFKGTRHRRAWHISNRMERVGGELNAYTTKEHTMLYSVFPSQHLARALDLLADLVRNSVFPADEVERERDVVLEEVASYRDSPADAVADDFEDLVFAGSGPGHNVLGTTAHLHDTQAQDCAEFLRTHYVPENMVLFVVGNAAAARVMRMAEHFLGDMPAVPHRHRRLAPALLAPRREATDMQLHQAHTMVGARVPGMHHEARFALSLLNNLLAGPGMNSLLNMQLRERRGYVYTVESSLSLMNDCGLLEIYLGCDHKHVDASLRIIHRITHDLAEHALPARRLDAAKRQYCGQLLLAADSTEWLAMHAGRSMLYYNHVSSLREMTERVMAVTPEQVREAARLITEPHTTVLTLL
ncbi:MAG: insulinase family protein [Muribaculaceae bacterium]|nr:insulinase family protein [Muribaculaceae bacterium]